MTEEARIEADKEVPMIHIYRDFNATVEQLMRAHTDPELFTKWVGPNSSEIAIDYWDARDGGSFRYTGTVGGQGDEFAFRGCFHQVGTDRIVQTFTWEGQPDGVSLETLTFTDNGDGTTTLHGQSLCASFEERDGWLASGMETGVNDGYAKIDGLVSSGALD